MIVKKQPIKSQDAPQYTRGEEIANSITHGIGTVLSVLGAVVLLVRASTSGTIAHLVSVSVYGMCLMVLHLASTLYHGLTAPRAKHVFRFLDHCSIYLLIAGTYTPFMVLSLRGPWGWTMLVIIWVLAILGILYQKFFLGRYKKLSVVGYLAMGWLVVFAARQVWLRVPHGALAWVAAGGALYTLGILFYGWKRLPYHHAIWHLFVIAGSTCHYFAILLYLVPRP